VRPDRSRVSPPRERNRAERSGHGEAVRAFLASRRTPDGQRPAHGEIFGQFLHPARPDHRPELQAYRDPISAERGPVSQAAQFYLRRLAPGAEVARAAAELPLPVDDGKLFAWRRRWTSGSRAGGPKSL